MANIFEKEKGSVEIRTQSEQIFDLIAEIEKAAENGLVQIERRSPVDNFIHFSLSGIDEEKVTEVANSLLERYPSLHFMWQVYSFRQRTFSCIVYYYASNAR